MTSEPRNTKPSDTRTSRVEVRRRARRDAAVSLRAMAAEWRMLRGTRAAALVGS
jgi:hypothetical protein